MYLVLILSGNREAKWETEAHNHGKGLFCLTYRCDKRLVFIFLFLFLNLDIWVKCPVVQLPFWV